MMEMSKTKKKVFDAAIMIFNSKGFNGSTVREIAQKADVNPALISYYFNGKKGLLEQLLTSFLEQYIAILEEAIENKDEVSKKVVFNHLVLKILQYQSENHQLARLVYRELTLDSMLVREIMSTYLTKEKYYFQTMIETGIKQREFRKIPIMVTIMQLKGMLMMPFLQPQYMAEVLHIHPSERYFVNKYYNEIKRWIEEDLSLPKERSILSVVSHPSIENVHKSSANPDEKKQIVK